jgi:hypothetical protein
MKETKRGPGRPKGSKNKVQPTRRRTRRKFANTSAIAVAPASAEGDTNANADPVIVGFNQKRAQLQKQMDNLNAAVESYQQSQGVAIAPKSVERVPLTKKGTVDMRSAAGRQFITENPHLAGQPIH